MDSITKEDLKHLRLLLLRDMEELLRKELNQKHSIHESDWIRSKAVRQIMNISPASLQNIRITGKIRFRKVMGSYYYNKADLLHLFSDENH